MDEPQHSVVVYRIVHNQRASRLAQKQQAATGERQQWPGWLVFGVFMMTPDGDPTCVDYRVRAVPDLRDMDSWSRLAVEISDSMTGVGQSVPALVPLSGGVPRYVFEEASQSKLLHEAQAKIDKAAWGYVPGSLSSQALAIIRAGTDVKPGRPPTRPLREKLEILERVEDAFRDSVPLVDVAKASHMSRSALRDLLGWARHAADPRLFTNPQRGTRGRGGLTPEARLILAELRAGNEAHSNE